MSTKWQYGIGRSLRFIASIVSLVTSCLSFAVEPVAPPKGRPILQFIEPATAGAVPMVVVQGGRDLGVVEDAVFEVSRLSQKRDGSPAIWVETGRLKAIRVESGFTLAEVLGEESALSQALFPKFPGIMVGDFAKELEIRLARQQVVLPTQSARYQELFIDPKALATNFELSQPGRVYLEQLAAPLGERRLAMIMVEAYTDRAGNADQNQMESYQRARAVRQFLIEQLGFDPARVVALGFGESEQIGEEYIPGNQEANRRIVLKVKALAPPSR